MFFIEIHSDFSWIASKHVKCVAPWFVRCVQCLYAYNCEPTMNPVEIDSAFKFVIQVNMFHTTMLIFRAK